MACSCIRVIVSATFVGDQARRNQCEKFTNHSRVFVDLEARSVGSQAQPSRQSRRPTPVRARAPPFRAPPGLTLARLAQNRSELRQNSSIQGGQLYVRGHHRLSLRSGGVHNYKHRVLHVGGFHSRWKLDFNGN